MLNFQYSPEDEFWKVKMERYIKDCNSMDELKQISTLLVKICCTRQVVIKGLIKESLENMHLQIQKELSAPKESLDG
jgi:hypothetical protein